MQQNEEWNTVKLLNISSSYWQACTLHAAVKLEIFSQIGDRRLTAREVAEKIEGSDRGVTPLLNALIAMGLLKKDGELYHNSPAASTYLVKDAPRYIGYIIMHHHHLVDGWAQLDSAVKSGAPVEKRSYGEEKERESFQLGMFNLAMAIAPKLAEQVDLSSRRHLLDLGGGPGTHAIHFCLANPELKATIFDLPTTRSFAMKTVKDFDLEERIDFLPGNFLVDEIKGTYDVAWLSQILHSLGPEECEALIDKTVQALAPGGLIMIHEFFLEDTMDGPLFPALFSLNMLINNERGRSYSEKEIQAMLERAGVGDILRLPFQGANDSYVICGTAG